MSPRAHATIACTPVRGARGAGPRRRGGPAPIRGLRAAPCRVTAVVMAVLALVLGLGLADGAAAAPSISAELHPDQVELGQDVRLSVTVVGVQNAPAPRLPRIDGLDVRSLGQTMSMQIVGGQISSEVTHNFLIRPLRAGTFSIPALTVQADGRTLETMPLTLRVTAPGRGTRPAPAPAPQGGRPAAPGKRAARPSGDEAPPLRLTIAGIPDRDLWVGELIPVDIRLDVREGVQVTEVTAPTLAGHAFTLAQPGQEKEPPRQAVTIGGARYTRYSLEAALSAVSPGEHDLRLSMTVTAIVPRPRRQRRGVFNDPFFDSFFDDPFFGGTRERREVPLEASVGRIEVKPLPEVGRPDDFSGGIGRFRVEAEASPTDVTVGDPLTLTVTVTGEGNFDRLVLPPLPSSTEWKTYPQSATVKSRDELGYTGTKTFEQVLIPERVDVTAVPARGLSYFDPERGRYERANTQPIALVVKPAPRAALPPTRPAAEAGETADADAYEIAPNQIELGRLRPSLAPLALDRRFVALQLLPLVLLAAGFAWARRRDRLAGDAEHQRAVVASKTVRAQLALADRARRAGDAVAFFAAARRALQERVASAQRPAATLTADEVESCAPDGSPARAAVREIFAMADAVAYSGARPEASALAEWHQRLVQTLKALRAGGGPR